jgi:hypothetical protein
MPTSSFVRNAGISCIAGALIAMVANALSAYADPAVAGDIISYPLSTGVFATAQILVFSEGRIYRTIGISLTARLPNAWQTVVR